MLQGMQSNPGGERCVSPEQGEDSWLTRQDAAGSASSVGKGAAWGADVIFEAFPSPQGSFDDKKQVPLLSKINEVHTVTKKGQPR